MTREIATCGEAETAVSIMGRMTTGKFRHIPVVEKDRLVGIVSIGDIVKHRLWEMEQESAALRDYIQSA
jgi:predicted transcriptional regulator